MGVQEGGKEDKETRKLEKSEMCTECGRLGEKGGHIVSVYTRRLAHLISIDCLNALIKRERSTFTFDFKRLCARRFEGLPVIMQIAIDAK